MRWNVTDAGALLGYYRHENDVGNGSDRNADMIGLSYQQKVAGITLEPGYVGVRGDGLTYNELTTGLNHSLGAIMMIYGGQLSGDSDTAYLKAVKKLGGTASTSWM